MNGDASRSKIHVKFLSPWRKIRPRFSIQAPACPVFNVYWLESSFFFHSSCSPVVIFIYLQLDRDPPPRLQEISYNGEAFDWAAACLSRCSGGSFLQLVLSDCKDGQLQRILKISSDR